MPNIIQIKRSTVSAIPTTLAAGELAYSEKAGSKILYIGVSGNVIEAIGGKDLFDKVAGIEVGATADQTGAEIKTLYQAEPSAFTDALYTKLAGIEVAATADQTGAEIKVLYEGELNTNALTDALLAKLNGIATGADVTGTANVAAAGAVMESDVSTALMGFVVNEPDLLSNSPTKVPTQQSVKTYVDNKLVSTVDYKGSYNAATNTPKLDSTPIAVMIGDMYTVTVAGTFFTKKVQVGDVLIAEVNNAAVEADWTIVNKNLDNASIKTSYESNANTNAFTDALLTKLNSISSGATPDQTGAQIKAAYEAMANTNAFTDALLSKLNGVAAGATSNSPDAVLLNRSNHTGTQPFSSISDYSNMPINGGTF